MQDRSSELPALTGLRGFAALWVLLYHVWAMAGGPALRAWDSAPFGFSKLLSVGWAGVDVFFCLSAFLLVLPYARWRYADAPRPATGRYLLRRTLRIYPAYLAQLAVLLAIIAITGVGRMPDAGELFAHLLLWFNLGSEPVTPLVGVWFTLPIEFAFYLLLPFLAVLIDRRRWPWLLLGAVLLTIAYRVTMHALVADEPIEARVIAIERLPGRFDQFVIGMLAGAAFVAAGLRNWRPQRPDAWFFAGIIGLLALIVALHLVVDEYWNGHPLLFVWHGLFSACLVPVLLAAAWDARPALRLLANAPMRRLGDISFGVYLWHMPMLLWILPHLPATLDTATRFWILLALVLPATLLVAQVSHVCVERPFLRIAHRPRAEAATPTS